MPPLSPQARFLLRGSAFIFLFLTAWWFLFRDPLLSVLHTASHPFPPYLSDIPYFCP